MRLMGFLFVIVLILAAVGYFRGWFSVTTTHASGKSELTLGVDNDKISGDTRTAAAELGKLSAKAVAAVKSLATKVSPEESELQATVEKIDLAGRDLIVAIGSQSIDLHVPSAVPISRDGATAGFDQLQPTTRAKFFFKHAGDDQQLARIEILR